MALLFNIFLIQCVFFYNNQSIRSVNLVCNYGCHQRFCLTILGFARLAMKRERMMACSRGYRHFSLSPNNAEGHNVTPPPNHTSIGCITDDGEGHRKEDMRHNAVQTYNTPHGCPAVIISTHRRLCSHLCVKLFIILSSLIILEKLTKPESCLTHLWHQNLPPDVCNRLWCKFLNSLTKWQKVNIFKNDLFHLNARYKFFNSTRL